MIAKTKTGITKISILFVIFSLPISGIEKYDKSAF